MAVALAAAAREEQALQAILYRSSIWSFVGEADAQCPARPNVRRPASEAEGRNEGKNGRRRSRQAMGSKSDVTQLGANERAGGQIQDGHEQCMSQWEKKPNL